jgi:transcriptional regulator with XRE-family HTH domain
MSLGNKVKYYRKNRELTQAQLSELINKDVSTISKIETNVAKPSLNTLKEISKALNVELVDLLDD